MKTAATNNSVNNLREENDNTTCVQVPTECKSKTYNANLISVPIQKLPLLKILYK